VILLNLDLIRKDKIFDLFVAEIYKKHKTQDQDIFNIVCNRKILNLPLRYGMINRTEYIKSAHIYNMTKKEMKNEIKNIKIVH
jgi:lipopolysaccharide biosynthesis glycosyltransferase